MLELRSWVIVRSKSTRYDVFYGCGAVTASSHAQNPSKLIREQGVVKESIGRNEEDMRKHASEAVARSAKVGKIFRARSARES